MAEGPWLHIYMSSIWLRKDFLTHCTIASIYYFFSDGTGYVSGRMVFKRAYLTCDGIRGFGNQKGRQCGWFPMQGTLVLADGRATRWLLGFFLTCRVVLPSAL